MRPRMASGVDDDSDVGLAAIEERAVDESLAIFAQEVAHELAASVPFFKALMTGVDGIEEEDRSIALEEIEKMRRMLGVLRSMKLPPRSLAPQSLRALIDTAFTSMARRWSRRGIVVEHQVGADVVLMTDAETALRVLRLLATFMWQCADENSVIRITGDELGARLTVRTQEPSLEFVQMLWKATHRHGEAVRWMLAHGLARSLGWRVQGRVVERTVLVELGFRG
jgi:hypothetical protein